MAAVTFIGLPLMCVTALGSPIISFLYFGRIDGVFILFVAIISAACVINIFSAPSYILAMGRGRLLWNIMDHLVSMSCCVLFFILARGIVGPIGIVLIVVFSLAVGNMFSLIMNSRSTALPFMSSFEDLSELLRSDFMRLWRWDLRVKGP
jgi:hypothetical protein